MKAYHFLKNDMTGGCGDEPAWVIGEERTVEGKLKMCAWGYHASPSWYDALGYAKGNMACIVELKGEIKKDTDKYVARTRKLIDVRNAEKVLRAWGCDCAERALRIAKVTDERSWNAIRTARLYNDGRATEEELAAARAATWDAAWYAASAAARDTAWYAASAAARDTAWYAASAAARDTAWYAASAAARDTAWYAVRAAARATAWDAEIKWQKRRLNRLMKELFKEEIRGELGQ